MQFYRGEADEAMKVEVMITRTSDKAAEIVVRHPEWRGGDMPFEMVWKKFRELLVPSETPQKAATDLMSFHQGRQTTAQEHTDEFETLFDAIPEEILSDRDKLKCCFYRFTLAPFFQQRLTEARVDKYDEARNIVITLDRPPPDITRTNSGAPMNENRNRLQVALQPRKADKPYERPNGAEAKGTNWQKQPSRMTNQSGGIGKVCFQCEQPGHFIKDCPLPGRSSV